MVATKERILIKTISKEFTLEELMLGITEDN